MTSEIVAPEQHYAIGVKISKEEKQAIGSLNDFLEEFIQSHQASHLFEQYIM